MSNITPKMLVLAAKAIGLLVKPNCEEVDIDDKFLCIQVRDSARERYRSWNPKDDTEAALSLAALLGFDILFRYGAVGITTDNHLNFDGYFWESFDEEADGLLKRLQLMRIVIIRAAAATGEKMYTTGIY